MFYQNVTIVGNVGRDAEFKYTPHGIGLLKFSVAVNKTIGKGDEKRQTITWFNVTLWRECGEALSPYIKAGMQVLVTGKVTAVHCQRRQARRLTGTDRQRCEVAH